MLDRFLAIVAPPLCTACGADARRAGPLCAACRAELARGAGVSVGPGIWAGFPYEGPAGALVRALKFSGHVALADVMAAQITAHAPSELLAGEVVPVPLHPSRRRRRGYNQAALLAESLGRRAGLCIDDCLVRSGDPAPQMGRGRRARMQSLLGRIEAPGRVPERALLVDDVVTTGATLAACAQALRAAGCLHVGAVIYARTSGR